MHNNNKKAASLAILIMAVFLAGCNNDQAVEEAGGIAALQNQVENLTVALEQTSAVRDIKRLQRAYGYYLDEALWDDLLDLMTDDISAAYGDSGELNGKAELRDFLLTFTGGDIGLQAGQLNDHLQLQPVITLSPDGKSARGHWRALIMTGQYGESAEWAEGPYENEYRLEDGVWKISRIRWSESFNVPYETGWAGVAENRATGFMVPDFATILTGASWPDVETGSDTPKAIAALTQRTESLRRRLQSLHNGAVVENLQNSYGYLVEAGRWEDAASLFTGDATYEYGDRGVFRGLGNILAMLRQSDYPRPGTLYNHIQMQPVIDLDESGEKARMRGRALDQIGDGESAWWGEGIYENSYRLVNGVWKIDNLHFYPNLLAPYQPGWGKAFSTEEEVWPTLESLEPDSPPTGENASWPGVTVPPFHYDNPVAGEEGAGKKRSPAVARTEPPTEMDLQLDRLATAIQRLEDERAIEILQRAYGYYTDKALWTQVADLFTDDGTVEYSQRGVVIGKDRIREFLSVFDDEGIKEGSLRNDLQLQPVITVADNGLTAKGRWRALQMNGNFGNTANWGGAVYENEYVKEEGIWKISKLHVYNTFFVNYDPGWIRDAFPHAGVTRGFEPDLPPSEVYGIYPDVYVVPFHYPNPVTGK